MLCYLTRGSLTRGYLSLAAAILSGAVLQPASAADGKEDLRFARGLVDRGWTVVAERVVRRGLEKASPADKERYRVLECHLLLREARSIGGSEARAEAFNKAFLAIDAILPADGKLKAEGDAANELGEFFMTASDIVSEEVQRELEAKRADELRKRAQRLVTAAEGMFQSRLDAARMAIADIPVSEEEESESETQSNASREEMEAAFNLAKARFQRAKITEGTSEKELAVKAAIDELETFQATYSETVLAFECALNVGLCRNLLEDWRRAAAAFEGASHLTDLFRDEAGRVVVDHPVAADIIQRALYFKAQACLKANQAADAKEATDRALRLFPGIKRAPIGYALRIESAKAISKLGKYEEAARVAQAVETEDPDGPWGVKAREFLGTLVGRANLGHDQVLRGIESGLERGDTLGAIAACRRVLSRPGLSADALASFHLLLGKSYSQGERFREAAIAFEELVERFPTHKLAPEATFEAMKSRILANARAPARLDQHKYEENLKLLTGKYRDSPQAAAGQFLKAEEAMEASRYDEAKKLYLEVPPGAGIYYDNALYQAGLAAWNQAVRAKTTKASLPHYKEAESILLSCLKTITDGKSVDEARAQNRPKLRTAARVRLANVYSSYAMKDFQKGLGVLQEIEREDQPSAADAGLVSFARVRTMAALGRIEDAVQAYKVFRQSQPSSRSLPQLANEIARAYDEKALKLRAQAIAGKTDGSSKGPAGGEYAELLRRALEYYADWADESKRLNQTIPPAALEATAGRALAIALEITGLPEGKDSFTDALDRADLPREEWQRAVRLLEAARPRAGEVTDWKPLARLGRAYGFIGEWQKAKHELEEALVRGGLLAAIGEEIPNPKMAVLSTTPELLDIFIDLGYAELLPAKKGQLARPQSIFDKAFNALGAGARETCPWWKCRYGFLACEVREGKYDSADGTISIWQQQFPDWDKGGCGLQGRFEELKKEVKSKAPAAQRR